MFATVSAAQCGDSSENNVWASVAHVFNNSQELEFDFNGDLHCYMTWYVGQLCAENEGMYLNQCFW